MNYREIFKSKKYKWVILGVLIVGFFISSFYVVLNLISILENTNTLLDDSKAVVVDSINPDESITLQDGVVIKGEDIKAYVKINKGSGTWYLEEGSMLAVEISFGDISGMLFLNIAYYIVLLAIWIAWLVKKIDYETVRGKRITRLVKCESVLICLLPSLLMYFMVWGYLEKVLNMG